MFNQATIMGRVGKIETRPTNSGTTVTNISIVTSKKFMKNGVREEKITWHNITCFSKLSEIAEKYVVVGDLLLIQGEMDSQKYTGQDGIEKVKHYIIANDLKLMPKSKEHKPEPKEEAQLDDGFPDSDIPF